MIHGPDLSMLAAYDRISLGIKPSGQIHLGTALTLFNGIYALSNNPQATLDVCIMDLDFDFLRGIDFVSFMGSKDPTGCHGLMKDHTSDEVRHASDDIARYFGVSPDRINIGHYSGITSSQDYQDMITHLFTTHEGRVLLKRTIIPGTQTTRSLLSPICACNHSSTRPPRFEENYAVLRSVCNNPDCETKEFRVGISEPAGSNLFYLVDPIRDLMGPIDLHIFGGDYLASYGNSGISKAQRVHQLLSGLSGSPPDIYVGPVLLYNGVKVGKSANNVFTIDKVRGRCPGWVERLHTLVGQNQGKIDLAYAECIFPYS